MTDDLSPESSVLSPSTCVVTADGRGAVAVVRVWGPGALEVADRVFRPNQGRGLLATPVGRLRVGRIGARLGDEVVAVVVAGLGDGADGVEVEIQCHGGPAAIGLVLDALREGGAVVRSPRRWARHASGSNLRAEAEVALAQASTLKVAEILLDQAGGALDDELRRIGAASSEVAIERLDGLIARGRVGVRLVGGWRVVLAGRPNVGKSRLLNALAGYDRAIVAAEPGTTRDLVTARTALGGWPVELADTAGLRVATDPIEAAGVARARTHQREADLVVVVLDRSDPLTEFDRAILHDHPDAVVVANKSDLPASWAGAPSGVLAISAERGDGLEKLVETIAARLVPGPPPAGLAVPFRAGQVRRLQAIRDAFAGGRPDRARLSIERWIAR